MDPGSPEAYYGQQVWKMYLTEFFGIGAKSENQNWSMTLLVGIAEEQEFVAKWRNIIRWSTTKKQQGFKRMMVKRDVLRYHNALGANPFENHMRYLTEVAFQSYYLDLKWA